MKRLMIVLLAVLGGGVTLAQDTPAYIDDADIDDYNEKAAKMDATVKAAFVASCSLSEKALNERITILSRVKASHKNESVLVDIPNIGMIFTLCDNLERVGYKWRKNRD